MEAIQAQWFRRQTHYCGQAGRQADKILWSELIMRFSTFIAFKWTKH